MGDVMSKIGAMVRLFTLLIALALTAFPGFAAETVTAFRTNITINSDATLDVTEAFSVNVEGKEIKRGIIRSLANGLSKNVTVTAVRRDGKAENFELLHGDGNLSVKIGNADVFLDHGPHHYEIVMRIGEIIGSTARGDILYWEVTGNRWSFPIESAEVTVRLPPGAEVLKSLATDARNRQDSTKFEVTTSEGQLFHARTTKTLQPGEGLSIAVVFTAGIVKHGRGI